jgi:hypothetical protein
MAEDFISLIVKYVLHHVSNFLRSAAYYKWEICKARHVKLPIDFRLIASRHYRYLGHCTSACSRGSSITRRGFSGNKNHSVRKLSLEESLYNLEVYIFLNFTG